MKKFSVILLFLLFFSSIINAQHYKKYFDEYGVKGSFVLYDMNNDTYLFEDSARCYEGFLPASTFKIPNSIIGLETGIIENENYVIPWDSVNRREICNRDMNLRDAIKYSCIAYYQELARRVGEEKMQEMVNKFDYGNRNISGGIDMFWLNGGLRISQMQQIDFLKKLYKEELPVSKRSMDIVKDIILLEDTLDYKLRGKTGWAQLDDGYNTGWLVGWVERNNNAYFFFAVNVGNAGGGDKFASSRREITEKILRDEGVLP